MSFINDDAKLLVDAGLLWVALAVFVILCAAIEIGFRLGHRPHAKGGVDERAISGTSTLTGGMLALVAFMLGLTINFAQSRYELRRMNVVVVANAIGTAWLRAKLVSGEEGVAVGALIVDDTKVRH